MRSGNVTTVDAKPKRILIPLVAVVASITGCITLTASPDPQQIEEGLNYARARAGTPGPTPSIYTTPDADSKPVPRVVLVVNRGQVDQPPRKFAGRNLLAGRAYKIKMNPTVLVVKSIAAYLDSHAFVEIVPEVAAAPDTADLVLEPRTDSVEWRTNMWRYAFFGARIEVRVELTLRDHTSGTEEQRRSDWVSGGFFWGTTGTGMANRVVRGIAHATALLLEEAAILERLPTLLTSPASSASPAPPSARLGGPSAAQPSYSTEPG